MTQISLTVIYLIAGFVVIDVAHKLCDKSELAAMLCCILHLASAVSLLIYQGDSYIVCESRYVWIFRAMAFIFCLHPVVCVAYNRRDGHAAHRAIVLLTLLVLLEVLVYAASLG